MFELVSVPKQKAMCEEAGIEYSNRKMYFKAGDGTVCCIEKPNIVSTVWYDDECADPLGNTDKSRWNGFVYYNMRQWDSYTYIDEWIQDEEYLKKNGCCCGRHASVPVLRKFSDNGAWVIDFYRRDDDDYMVKKAEEKYGSRPLTDEEVAAIPDLYVAMAKTFGKRLENYWKRYSDKVGSRGYWADR